MLFHHIFVGLLAAGCFAYPGEQHPRDSPDVQLAKRLYKANVRRGLEACSDKLQGRNEIDNARRAATVAKYRRDLDRRDTDTVLNTTHLSDYAYTPDTPESTIFASNTSCVLNPEGEVGPYWVKGEYVRNDLREDQPGVPVVLEAQFVDVNTCAPLEGVYWDLWNCNATGVYSSVVAQGNGNADDLSNYDTTFLRGIAASDADGVVQFETIFPGHYSGRTTHHHVVLHLNATVLPNNTLTGGAISYVGQLFWDQDIIYKVENTSPYNTNSITLTTNADDHVFIAETEESTSDPVFEYVYLGDELSDGLFGWITIAVNTSATYDPSYSFVWTSTGSIAESSGSE